MRSIGYAWVQNSCRPIYSLRPIKRGKNKGKIEVTYRASVNRFRKIIIPKEAVYSLNQEE